MSRSPHCDVPGCTAWHTGTSTAPTTEAAGLHEALNRAHHALAERDSFHAPLTAHGDLPCTPKSCYIAAALTSTEGTSKSEKQG